MSGNSSDGKLATDQITGLQWQLNSGALEQTWGAALQLCQQLDYGAYTDWRFPSRKELISLVSYFGTREFPDTPRVKGSSTTHLGSIEFTCFATSVAFDNPEYLVLERDKKTNSNVRCVRGGI